MERLLWSHADDIRSPVFAGPSFFQASDPSIQRQLLELNTSAEEVSTLPALKVNDPVAAAGRETAAGLNARRRDAIVPLLSIHGGAPGRERDGPNQGRLRLWFAAARGKTAMCGRTPRLAAVAPVAG
jgi:hypothetical protein